MSPKTDVSARAKRALQPVEKAWGALLDVVYPPRCGGCDRRGILLCPDCKALIRQPSLDLAVPSGLSGLVSAGVFTGPLREAVHKLKYSSDTPLAGPLGALISNALELHAADWFDNSPPKLVAVPLHKGRLRERGYNQATLLAKQVALLRGWTLLEGLERPRATRSQVGLGNDLRKANVAGAFRYSGKPITGTVVLIDDVCTTGATLSECAVVLRSAGAEKIYAATVARAQYDISPETADI